MAVQGTWNIGGYNLPDRGYTEWLRSLLGKPLSAEVQTTFNNPAVAQAVGGSAPAIKGASTTTQGPRPIGILKDGRTLWSDGTITGTPTETPTGTSTGTSTGTPTGTPTETPTGTPTPELDLYTQQWLAGLEAAKRQAQSLRNQGQNTFQRLIDAARGYSERAAELRDLGSQQITNTFNELAGGNARLGQDARQQALLRARAGGYGDSSKLGLLNQVTGNLAGMQGSALARKGENEALNLADYKAREAEAEQQRKAAQDYMTGIEEAAGELERQGIQNVGYDYGLNLSGLAQRLQAMQAMNPLNAQSLTQYTPDYSGLTNTLNSLLGGLTAQNRASGADQALTAVQPTTYQELLRRIRGTYAQ